MQEMSQADEAFTQATDAAPAAEVSTLPVYEVSFHIIPSVAEDGVGAVLESVRKAIGDVEIIAEGFPQRMRLAYTIERATEGKREKFTESYFGWVKFAAERSTMPALQEALRANRTILRYLVIETVREDIAAKPVRAVFTSDRLEGQTLHKPAAAPEKPAEVSQEELDKSIEALVTPE